MSPVRMLTNRAHIMQKTFQISRYDMPEYTLVCECVNQTVDDNR